MTTTAREKAEDLLAHYLTQNGQFGDRQEAESVVGLVIDAVADTMEMRQEQRGDELAVNGITVRDYFAAFALAGQIASMTNAEVVRAWQRSDDPWGWPAESAYKFADALLAERRKGGA